MPVPQLTVSSVSALNLDVDVLIVAVSPTPGGATLHRTVSVSGDDADRLESALRSIGFSGARDEVRRIPAMFGSAKSIALVGLGTESPDAAALRYAAGSATRQLRGVGTVAFDFPISQAEEVIAVLEGAAIGAYRFTEYRTLIDASSPDATDDAVAPAETGAPGKAVSPEEAATHEQAAALIQLTVIAPAELDHEACATQALATAIAIASVRDLVNTPASDLYPQSFADRAIELVGDLAIEVTVLDEVDLAREGFGGIVGVGQGSARPPRLVKAVWNPAGSTRHLSLVGKGITFDTGGLSLKPPTSMVGMKYDMTGAATALAVVVAAARLDLPLRVTAWLCLAENMPSGTAISPGDVLTMKNGRTVEVLNTDAEGRLVLADGLVAASAEQPDAIIDIATLTGAASVAMGNRYVAAMGDPDFVGRVVAAANRTGEPMWHMPLPAELRSMLDSDIADLTNVKIGNAAGGMLVAGIFPQEFVGLRDGGARLPWAHLDIAGAAHNALSGYGFTGKGPTGVTVRALLEVAADLSRE